MKEDIGFLRLPQVLEIIPVSKSTWWNGVRKGIFPKSIKLTARTTVWLKSDIENLCESIAGNKGSKKTE